MNTSRFSLLLGAVGLAALGFAGCSSPAEGDDDGANNLPPNPLGMIGQQGGAGGAPTAGLGGSTGGAVGGSTGTLPTGQGGQVAGLGGSPAGVGGSAPVGNGEVPIGMGLTIQPGADGFVQGTSNGLGIQGAFFAASDATSPAGMPTGTGSSITLNTMTAGSVCVSGTLAAIAPNPAAATDPTADAFLYSTYWGGTLGMNLRQVIPAAGMALPASGWPQVSPAGRVTGFSYTITANAGTMVPTLRFTVDYVGKPAGATFCSALPVGGGTSALFANVTQSCWDPGGMRLPETSDLLTIQWSIIPSEMGPTNFNFCLSNLTAIVSP